MKKIVNVFIGGSASLDINDSYIFFASELGRLINERDYHIIFDGCAGLPSVVFKNLTGFDRATVCYTVHYIAEYSNYQKNDYQYLITQSLRMENQSEMTDTIIELSDAFIFLKGQLGTLEELFRAINGKKNLEHDHPIVIVNLNHEWDNLINILDSCNTRGLYHVTDNPIDCLNYIEQELYKETSSFYKDYVINDYAKRNMPIYIRH